MIEPDPALHHIFTTFDAAQTFYDLLLVDESITEDVRGAMKPPRQAIGNLWILDKVT